MRKTKPSFNLLFSDSAPGEKAIIKASKEMDMLTKWAPDKSAMLNILAYSRCLSIKKTISLGTLFLNMN